MVAAALEAVLRRDRGRLLAALAARTGDLRRAEDALQEACAAALVHWGRTGLPDRPEGWLLRAGLRKAIDAYRRERRAEAHRDLVDRLGQDEAALAEAPDIPDDRLRLIFACCHPALAEKTRVALTLRTVCGLTPAQVAAVFLDSEATMAQRLFRARAKIAAAGIPFAVPGPEEWPDRLQSVLTVVYLVFTAGYAAPADLGRNLCEEAIFLAGLVVALAPGDAEAEGCLALLRLTHGRARARLDSAGCSVPPGRQDRALWDHAALDAGRAILDRALARGRPGPFQIKAAIAACHARAEGSDWPQIAALYRALWPWEPTGPVALAQAVAQMETGDLPGAAAALAALAEALDDYQPYHAARAEVLRRLGKPAEAADAYDRAIAQTTRPEDAAFLIRARATLAL